MTHKHSSIFITLLLFVYQGSIFSQSNKGKVVVPTIEYVEDNFNKNSKDNNPGMATYGNAGILLENKDEDLFEDYEGKAIIDDQPKYTSRNTYVLEKVVYTKTEIIFSLAFYFPPGSYQHAIFYPRNHHHHWFLKDLSTGKRYSFKSVHKIRKNGTLESKKLMDFPLKMEANTNTQTVFTCRVHFDRLPLSTREVHLIEGRSKAKDKNHFNFFNIKIKQPYLD